MRNNKYVVALLLIFVLGGCAKDKKLTDSKQYVAVYQPVANVASQPYAQFVTLTDAPTGSFDIAVNYGGPNYPASDVNVTLAVDRDSFNVFNEANDGAFTLLEDKYYQLPASLVIHAGQLQGLAAVTLQTQQIAQLPKERFVIPVTITNASDSINRNLQTVFYEVKVTKQKGFLSLKNGNGLNAVAAPVIIPDNASQNPVVLPLTIQFSGDSAALYDIPVAVKTDIEALNTFLASDAGSGYELLPDSCYTFTDTAGIIVKNTSEIALPVKVYTDKISSGHQYILPVTLKDVVGYFSDPAKTTALLNITVQNKYAGMYKATGTRDNYNADGTFNSTVTIDKDKELRTVDVTTSLCSSVANLSDWPAGQNFVIKVNADNTVNLSGYYAGPAPIVDYGGTSTYDSVTKTFKVFYKYTNTNGTVRVMKETWVRK